MVRIRASDALLKLQRSLDQVIQLKGLRIEECDRPIVRVGGSRWVSLK